MKKEKRSWIGCRIIAAVLCLAFCLQSLAPAENVFAAYTSKETETHNTAKQKLGSYTTAGYVVTAVDRNGNTVTLKTGVHKETVVAGNKTYTTNSLDMEELNWDSLKNTSCYVRYINFYVETGEDTGVYNHYKVTINDYITMQ